MEYQAGRATMLPLPGPKSRATILVLMTEPRDSWLWPLAAWWKKPRPRPLPSELLDAVGVVSYVMVPFACALSLLYLIAPLALQVIPTPAPKTLAPRNPRLGQARLREIPDKTLQPELTHLYYRD